MFMSAGPEQSTNWKLLPLDLPQLPVMLAIYLATFYVTYM